jgi:sphingomyelin phosphodiesterase acid-like 3
MLPLCAYPSVKFAGTDTFISVADIHFTPFTSCSSSTTPCPVIQQLIANPASQWPTILQKNEAPTVSSYNEDTNYALLVSALKSIKQNKAQYSPQFMIILGDFLGHHYQRNYQFYSGDYSTTGYQDFVNKTYTFLIALLQQNFPSISIYPVLGNNDSYTTDYYASPKTAFYTDFSQMWSNLLIDSQNRQMFLNSFPQGGYYAITTKDNIKLIVLNTIFFSTSVQGENNEQGANEQLQWLNNQLALALKNQQKVWLFFHIPFGVDAYATSQAANHVIQPFWQASYNNQFMQLLANYGNLITAIFAGHTHSDGFMLNDVSFPKVYLSVTPAISPIFGNNPGYKVYFFDPATAVINNMKTYYLPENNPNNNQNWAVEYDFNNIYQPTCTYCNIAQGMANINETNKIASAYQNYYAVSNPNAQPITNGMWLPYYWCAIKNFTVNSYANCLQNYYHKAV